MVFRKRSLDGLSGVWQAHVRTAFAIQLSVCAPALWSLLLSCRSSTAPVQQLEGQAAVLSPNGGIKSHIFNFWATALGVSEKSILADFKRFFFSFQFSNSRSSSFLIFRLHGWKFSLNLVIYNTQIHPKLQNSDRVKYNLIIFIPWNFIDYF